MEGGGVEGGFFFWSSVASFSGRVWLRLVVGLEEAQAQAQDVGTGAGTPAQARHLHTHTQAHKQRMHTTLGAAGPARFANKLAARRVLRRRHEAGRP